jgi:hypothetical protein
VSRAPLIHWSKVIKIKRLIFIILIVIASATGFIFMNPNDPNYEPPEEGVAPEKA